MSTLVLIPAYNEADQISAVVKSVQQQGYDVLVVDDGSKDQTVSLARQAGAKVLVHKLNRGQGAALKTGIEFFFKKEYEYLVFFDADGQMRADEINKVLEPLLLNKFEVALGSRFLGRAKNLPISKKITLKLALQFTRILTGLRLTDVHNGFQAWSRSALRKINLIQDRQAYASELLNEIADHQLKYTEVPVTITYHEYGQSILNSFKIVWDLMIKK